MTMGRRSGKREVRKMARQLSTAPSGAFAMAAAGVMEKGFERNALSRTSGRSLRTDPFNKFYQWRKILTSLARRPVASQDTARRADGTVGYFHASVLPITTQDGTQAAKTEVVSTQMPESCRVR